MRKEMKKSYLMIAAAAMVMASCAENYELKNDLKDSETPVKIDFASFAEKATKGNVTDKSNLEFYHNTFSVIGSKKSTVNGEVQYVFRSAAANASGDYTGITNTYVSGDAVFGDWKYDNARYWDKQANYNFVAYAPAAAPLAYYFASSDAEVGNAANDLRTSKLYVLVGTNVQTTPSTTENYNGFAETTASGDIDLMTSSVEPQDGTNHETVHLQFKHILAKLNVAVAKSSTLASADVVVNYITIKGLKDAGVYSERTASGEASGEAEISGWTASVASSDYTLKSVASGDVEVGTKTGSPVNYANYKYFIESLVMPQTIASGEAVLEISYTTTTKDENGANPYSETNVATIDFGNAIQNSFKGRCNYTLNISIEPAIIKFDANVYQWADKVFGVDID